jgi:hypothetical protein
LEVDQEAAIECLYVAMTAGDLPIANPTAADRPTKGYGRRRATGEASSAVSIATRRSRSIMVAFQMK